jgi:hypothetical protein
MRRSLGAILVALVLCVSIPAARAGGANQPSGFQPNNPTWLQAWDQWADQLGDQVEDLLDSAFGIPDVDSSGGNGGGGSGAVAAPEIDPVSALAALTLLAGGLAVIRGRRTE